MKKIGITIKQKTILNNTYNLKTKSITKALNAIDNFISKMELFEKKHTNYKHDVNLISIDGIWNVDFTMKDEK